MKRLSQMAKVASEMAKNGGAMWAILIGHDGGAFKVASPVDKVPMKVIISFGEGWDHVSVGRDDRIPTWEEMEYVKRAFFNDTECAMQLHVPVIDHINHNPNVLHIWRPQHKKIPRPPQEFV